MSKPFREKLPGESIAEYTAKKQRWIDEQKSKNKDFRKSIGTNERGNNSSYTRDEALDRVADSLRRVADGVDGLERRLKNDEWSEEARKAAAEARRKGSSTTTKPKSKDAQHAAEWRAKRTQRLQEAESELKRLKAEKKPDKHDLEMIKLHEDNIKIIKEELGNK